MLAPAGPGASWAWSCVPPIIPAQVIQQHLSSTCAVVCQVGDKAKIRQGLHPPRTGHGKGFITYSFNQHFSSVSLVPGQGGERDKCGPWPLRMHCQEEGMHKETVINQLGEAGEVFDKPLRLTRVWLI